MTEEIKTLDFTSEPNIKVEVKEERRPKNDNRSQIMRELGIRQNHPYFLEIQPQLNLFNEDLQCIFLKEVKKQCDIYDEEEREFYREQRMKDKMNTLKQARKKREKF